jgi:hypothetical protein
LAVVVVAAVAVVALVLTRHHRTTPQASRPSAGTRSSPVSSTGVIPPVTNNSPPLIQAIDQPSATLPTGFTTQAFSPSQTQVNAAFSMAVPSNWQVQQPGPAQQVFFKAPDGVSYVEVDLTSHTKSDMVAEAKYIRSQALAQGNFPGYKPNRLSAEDVRDTRGAIWAFYYKNSAGTLMKVEDILFILQTKNGPQSYAILATSPNSIWQSTMLPRVESMLATFQPNPLCPRGHPKSLSV